MNVEDLLAANDIQHVGVKGMHWGVRKEESVGNKNNKATDKNLTEEKTTEQKSNRKRTAAIILGSAVGLAAIAVGAYYLKKRFSTPISKIEKSPAGEKFAKAVSKEPVGIVHAARGKDYGWTFPQKGGLDEPLKEYDKAGFDKHYGHNIHWKYGDNKEKIAARFDDPEHRRDRAGRKLEHEVMLPKEMASKVKKFDDIPKMVWPLIKDAYDVLYDKKGARG